MNTNPPENVSGPFHSRMICTLILLISGCPFLYSPVSADEQPGLIGKLYTMKQIPSLVDELKGKPQQVRVSKRVDLRDISPWTYEHFVYIRWQGRIRIESAGEYTFHTSSDDGSRIRINGNTVAQTMQRHRRTSASGHVKLSAGTHSIEIDYLQASGGVHLTVSWTRPDGQREPLPTNVLLHTTPVETIDTHPPERKHPLSPAHKMAFGPYLSVTTDVAPENWAYKAKVIDLSGTHTNVSGIPGGMAFDSDLLRFAGAWTGGLLELSGLEFKAGTPDQPRPASTPDLLTPQLPGWSRTGSFHDPRSIPHGPVPESIGEYRGLYLYKNNTVLSYRVGDCDILDAPSLETRSSRDLAAYARTLRLSPSKESLTHLLVRGDGPGSVVVDASLHTARIRIGDEMIFASMVGDTSSLSWAIQNNRILLKVRPSERIRYVKILMWRGDPNRAGAFRSFVRSSDPPVQLDRWTEGGPRRWPEAVRTSGRHASKSGAFALDTIPVPFDNPYDAWMRTAAFDFYPGGNAAAVSTWNGDVWKVSGLGGDLDEITWNRVATGLHQPLGLAVVDGTVYTAGRDQITRLHDLNGDGEYDFYESFNDDLQATKNFHEFVSGLRTGPRGHFFFARGGPVAPGGRGFEKIVPHHGDVIRVSPDGEELDVYASGLRAPNGLAVGPGGRVTVGVQQGTYVPTSGIYAFNKKGGYASVPPTANVDPEPTYHNSPLCWIPHDVDNSSAGQAHIPPEHWGPLGGKMLHFSYGTSRMFLVMNDPDQHQAALVRFPLKFRSGVMRGRFHPDSGHLYTTGLKGWQTNALRTGAFQRVRHTGKEVRFPVSLDIRRDHVVLRFATPLDTKSAESPHNYLMRMWNVKWSDDYGSDRFHVTQPDRKGKEPVEVTHARVIEEGHAVKLSVPDLEECTNYELRFRLRTRDGTKIRPGAVYGTVNEMP